MDERYVRAVYKVFKALYDKGYIYRDNYMVNWDPGAGTAISDLEVEHREVEDTLYHIDYPLESGDGQRHGRDGAPRDDAGRHGRGGEPERRALPRPGRRRPRSCRSSAARLPVIADEYVEPEFGTGALKITPGHDPNDFEIGRKPRPRGDLGDRRGRPHDRRPRASGSPA